MPEPPTVADLLAAIDLVLTAHERRPRVFPLILAGERKVRLTNPRQPAEVLRMVVEAHPGEEYLPCRRCGLTWPCPTIRVIAEGLGITHLAKEAGT